MSATRFKFVVEAPIAPELLRHQPLEAINALAPWDAIPETIETESLKIRAHRLWPEAVFAIHTGTAEKKPPSPPVVIEYPDSEGGRFLQREAEEQEEPVIVCCPQCGAEQEDLDGFGVLHCPLCGFCTHISVTGLICGLCGAKVE
jgi:hypothetical protein